MTGGALPEATAVLDAGDQACGELILLLKQTVQALGPREVLKLVCRDPGAREDLPAWCRLTGHRLLWADGTVFLIERKER